MKEIEKLTKLEDNKFSVKYKGDAKTYLVEDTKDDLILTWIIANIVNGEAMREKFNRGYSFNK